MTKRAARVGDMTAHGTPLGPGPGCPTVIIEGKSAWRVGDTHTCPVVDGVTPHAGGAVTSGSASVLVGGQPAAREGDFIIELGPPNAIVVGAQTVLIG